MQQEILCSRRRLSQCPPRPLFFLVLWLGSFLQWLLDVLIPPPQRVLQKSVGFLDSHIVFMAIQLGIPDALGDTFQPLKQLAEELGVQAEALERLLKGAVQIGFFRIKRSKSWELLVANNRLSSVLRKDHYSALRPLVGTHYREIMAAFRHFDHAMQTSHKAGAPTAFAKEFGADMWDFYRQEPGRQKDFSQGMKSIDALGARALAADHEWSRYRRIFDIGGATGSFLANIMSKHAVKGAVCDQSHVLTEATEIWASNPKLSAMEERISFIEINFLQADTLPKAEDGDCYLMRQILHDWDDRQSALILSNIRQAMGRAKAHLVIVEMSPTTEKRGLMAEAQSKSDLIMMCMLKGKERCKAQWESLFQQSGFKLKSMTTTRTPFSVVVAVPDPESFKLHL